MTKNLLAEKYIAVIRLEGGYNSNLPITLNGSSGNLTVNNLTVKGTSSITSDTITSASANAFSVGPNGTTNPTFNIDASTASAATGLNIKSAAAGAGVAFSVITSGTNENLTIDGAGSGTIGINTTSTTSGLVTVGNSTSKGGLTVQGPTTVSSSSASALAVGLNGATNPAFSVNANTASSVTGVTVISAASGAGVQLNAISSNAAESLTISSVGNGNINLSVGGAGAINTNNALNLNSGSGMPAGGSNAFRLLYGSTATGLYAGSGAPTVSGGQGSVYIRSDGTNTFNRVYVNSSGSTTWLPVSGTSGPNTPTAINSTATASAAQIASGYITSTSAAAVTITLPTATQLATQLGAVQGTVFDCYFDNTAGANTVTVAAGAGMTASNLAAVGNTTFGLLTFPATAAGQGCIRFMFSSASACTYTRIS